jgi:AcrR family transcriptional regulator
MVQKEPARRGRPRAYDPATALAQATAVFWNQGYAETSLDDLSRAMGMNRPSLYGAFGDKKSLYLAALAQYGEAGRQAIERALGQPESLRAALQRFYAAAIDLYLTGEEGARGCLLIGTATTEAVLDPEIRAALRDSLLGFEAQVAARLQHAKDAGDLPADAHPAALAKIASAVLHSLAIRARAGETREELETLAAAGVVVLCG